MGARAASPSAHAAFHDSPADGRASCCLPLRGCAAPECLRLWADRQARLQGCACCRESRMLAAARSPSPLDWDGGCVGLGWRGCARRWCLEWHAFPICLLLNRAGCAGQRG